MRIARIARRSVALAGESAIAVLLSAALLPTVSAATAPSLGTAASFAVLGGSTVTNTGPTVLNGDLGVSPGNAIVGFPPGIVVAPGATHAGDATAANAQSDVTTAYNTLAGEACNTVLTGQDLGGLTLTPGVYCFSSSAQLTGALTLDAQGNPNAVFVFQIGSALTTASNSSVNIINGGSACNVFWQIGSSATLGTTTKFQGSVLALTSITLNTGATLSGRALARNGAVTLDTNSISISTCNAASTGRPFIAKSFGAVTVIQGGSTSLSFTLTNPNATALTGVQFTDTLPGGLIVSTPNGLTGFCGGGIIVATAGSNGISLTGGSLPANGSCTFSVNVTGIALGPQTNSVTVSDTNAGTGNTAVAVLTVILAPAFTKTFANANADIDIAGNTTLTFTLTNPNTFALTGVTFSDTLPSGLALVNAAGASVNCGAGANIGFTGTNLITVTGVTLAAGGTCTLTVTNIFGILAGSYTNTTSTLGSIELGPGPAASAGITVLPVIAPGTAFEVGYAANLNIGDSVIDITNTGFTGGNLCVNLYAFDSAEEMISCCSCLTTPNGLNSLSGKLDLTNNPLTPVIPTSITVALLSSLPSSGPNGTSTVCNPAIPNGVFDGTLAWGTTLEPSGPAGFGTVPVRYHQAGLSTSEFAALTSLCNFIQSQGSGYGICSSCRTSGLGGVKR